MAWMRMMGAESVAYHQATVLERGDDYPGQALAYYASRGETPLIWGGAAAGRLGLYGAVNNGQYEAIFGPGGARNPASGERLVCARRPGMELVISAHKSVAELGVIGRAEDMHAIMDAERDATLAYLEAVTRTGGGRRGRAATPTATSGLVYAVTRHATSRAGDPCPHDHVLVANLVEMLDGAGGWKAATTALWREHLHAATMVGRVAAARIAVDLGYGIAADPGPSGRLGHWRIVGIPDEILQLHSKRAAEITAAVEARGDTGYRARRVAARATRAAKRHAPDGELIARWRAELASLGWTPEALAASIDRAAGARIAPRASLQHARLVVAAVLSGDSELARRKVFARRHLIVALAPHLYGWTAEQVATVIGRAVADPEVIPLVGVAGAIEPVYSLASVIATEGAVADRLAAQLERADAPTATPDAVTAAVAETKARLGGPLAGEQRRAVEGICRSGRGAELIVGIAGSGKTTLLAAVAAAFEASGCEVIGTATAGQAARALGDGARLERSSTLAALSGRLDRGDTRLGERSVVILDEAGMTDDVDLARLATHVQLAGAKLIVVGDHRQLGAVGPGGALAALVRRHPDAVHRLADNRRQHNPDERHALDQLRDGNLAQAVAWYADHDRIRARPDRDEALQAAVDAWAADTAAGADTALLAWRRANVAELNTRARDWMAATGRLTGPELTVGDVAYRAGDRILALAPDHRAGLVTSQRATVTAVDPRASAVVVCSDDGRTITLTADQLGGERTGYAYANTVHRAQGATVERAHLFADGGGRELAYVAMSRARDTSNVWVVADDADQAAEDLTRDWSIRRTPTWAIDTGLPHPQQLTRTDAAAITPEQRIAVAAVLHARAATTAIGRPGRRPSSDRLEETTVALNDARAALAGLADSTRLDHHVTLGDAARHATEAEQRLGRLHDLIDRGGWRDRRSARRQLPEVMEAAMDAAGHLQTQVDAEAGRLQQEIVALEARVDDLSRPDQRAKQRWDTVVDQRTAATRRARPASRQVDRVRHDLDHPHRPPAPPRRILSNHTPPSWSAVPSVAPEPAPAHEAPGL